MKDLRLRLRALLFPGHVERDLQDELAFHVEFETRRLVDAGVPEAEARAQALARFGSTAWTADQCRDARGIRFFDALRQDVRYAIRSFRRAPTFAITVVGTIALGLGLNTALFTMFDAYVLTPFAVRDPHSLYQIEWMSRDRQWHQFTWAQYEEFGRGNPMFSETLAERHQLITRIEGHTVYALLVSGNYFQMLGVGAALGRTLGPADAVRPGGEAVVVLSYALWQRQFGGDPAIVGRTLLVQGHPCEVVGVAREGFVGLTLAPPHDLWLPITLAPRVEDGADVFGPDQPAHVGIVGRLRPGIGPQAAKAAVLTWAQHLTSAAPDDRKAESVLFESRATSIPLSPTLVMVFSPVLVGFGLVLLIACANVANMMLARGLARQREIGIRLTLGAARGRLVRQMLTESVLLAISAGAAGFLVSRAAIDLGVRVMFATLPTGFIEFVRLAPLPPDARVFGFTLVTAFATGLLFGLAPALQATRSNVVQMARGDFPGDFGPSRLRNGLVVAQITATAMLLVTAAVLLRSVQRVARIDPGFRTRDVISLDIRDPFRDRVLNALRSSPVVTAVAATSASPLEGTAPGVSVVTSERAELQRARYRYVSPDYFDVFGIDIVKGRTFTADEARGGAAVAIVSETSARRWWPDREAVGQSLQIVADARVPPRARIRRHARVHVIGVARDTAADIDNTGPVTSAIHFPIDSAEPGMGLLVRVLGDPEAASRSLDASLGVAAPGSLREIHKLQELMGVRLFPFRLAYWIAGLVGVLALLLTVSGVYGVLSYLVAQRAKEIGIRVALGASVSRVMALVMRQSVRLATLGLALGGLLAVGAVRLVAARLLMIDIFDGAAYLGGLIVVVAACLLASCIPALRAARIDPMVTLRAD